MLGFQQKCGARHHPEEYTRRKTKQLRLEEVFVCVQTVVSRIFPISGGIALENIINDVHLNKAQRIFLAERSRHQTQSRLYPGQDP
jgi:hypothetical protein